jgi:dihydrofolate reductase/AraC-like DNA-binding protein
MDQAFPLRVPGTGAARRVHFKPGGISLFAGMPAAELRDRWVPVDAVWPQSSDRIRNQVGDSASTAETLRVLEEELRSRLAEAPPRGLGLVWRTGRRLETCRGAVPVGVLADAAGVSGNHLATQFKCHVGVTPKRMARIYRFARLIVSVDTLRPVDWAGLAQTAGYFDQAHFSREFKDFTGHTPTEYLAVRRRFPAEQGFPPDSGPMPLIDFLQAQSPLEAARSGSDPQGDPRRTVGTVIMHNVVSVDGFIADENDDVGPLHDWYFSGDTPIAEAGGQHYDHSGAGSSFKVSRASAEYVRSMWASIGTIVMGRNLFDLVNGWEGQPPAGDHVVVVSHRPKPEGWHPEASYHFVDGVTAAIGTARELAGERTVAVNAGDAGSQILAAGLVDEVAMDVVPVVFGSGKRYFGNIDGQHVLEDPHVVIQGDGVLHLRFKVRR